MSSYREHQGNSKNFGKRAGASIIQPTPVIHVSTPGLTNSFSQEVYVNKFGQKKFSNTEMGSLPVPQSPIRQVEVRYPAKDYNDHGFFNGFPFLLQEDNEHLGLSNNFSISNGIKTELGSGIASRANKNLPVENHTSINTLGGGFDLYNNDGYFNPNREDLDRRAVTCNNFWNLAAIEVDFVVQTRSMPAGYQTGYAENPDFSSTEGLQYVSEDYEVVNSYNYESFVPHLRQYICPTGESQVTSIDPETHLFMGSGELYSSMFFHGQDTGIHTDFFLPLNIQPENTGAFTITFDEKVANELESRSNFGEKKAFNCNMMFDFNTKDRDHEGFVGSNTEYHTFPFLAYIVPADGWDFTVLSSKIKGVYYTYPQIESQRYAGDQASLLNYRGANHDISSFVYSKNEPKRKGGHKINYNNAEYTHVPFDPAVGKYDGSSDIYYGYGFEASSIATYLTPKLSTIGSDSEFRQKYTNAGKYPIVGISKSNLEFYCGAQRSSLVLSNSIIQKHYGASFKYIEQSESTSTYPKMLPGSKIARLQDSLRFAGVKKDINPRKIRNKANRTIDKIIPSRVIGRKLNDYTTKKSNFSNIQNVGARTSIPLDPGFTNFPNTQMVRFK